MYIAPSFSPSGSPAGRRRGRPRKEVVAPVPRPFDFGFSPSRPLVPLAAAMLFLNKNSKQVLALIEDGQLRWAFDIRRAGVERREVRVLRQSLFEFTGLHAPPTERAGDTETEFAEIMEKILPPGMVVTPTVAGGVGFKRRARATRKFQVQMRLPAVEFRQILFPREPILRGTEVAQCFSCLSQHIINLLKEKSLVALNLRRGPKASPLITRASVVEFLRQRRMV